MEQNSNIEKSTDETTQYQKFWDNYSLSYYASMNKNSIGLMCTLMALTTTHKKYTILDAGCGPGMSTKQITLDIPNYNSTVYAFDFSEQMIKYVEKEFSEYEDFNSNHHNHWEICKIEGKKINIQKDTEEIRKTKIGKVIKFFQGNIESLPFEDEQFDVYLSNLCLMLCEDVDKALSEAYRVVKKDGVVAFSIWGNRKDSKIAWKLFNQFYPKYGIDISNERSSYWLAEDTNALKERFLKAGFSDIRMEYTNEIYDCFDEQDYLVKFQGPGVNSILSKVKDDKIVKDLLEDVKNEANRLLVKEKNIPTLNCLVIVAFK